MFRYSRILTRQFHKWNTCGLWNGRRNFVCLSDQGPSMVTYGLISLETATPMQHASGRNPRGGDRHGTNHNSSRALCVELSELTSSTPNKVTGRELVRGQRKKCLSTLLSNGIGWMFKACSYCCSRLDVKFIVVLLYASRDQRHSSGKDSPPSFSPSRFS